MRRSLQTYLYVFQTVHPGDTVADGQHPASLLKVGGGGGPEDPLLQDGGDLPAGRHGGGRLEVAGSGPPQGGGNSGEEQGHGVQI